jgi:hypothetical protein
MWSNSRVMVWTRSILSKVKEEMKKEAPWVGKDLETRNLLMEGPGGSNDEHESVGLGVW